MNHKFTLGVVAGMSTLALAVPLLAQVSSAASTTSSVSMHGGMKTRPVPTVQNVQDMITHDTDFLTNIDGLVTVEKSAVQVHKTALTAAASITDDTQRQAAVEKAMQDERAAIEAALKATPALKSAMMPPMGFGGGMKGGMHGGMNGGMGGRMFDPTALAAKLGMTADELKAALASGKTIEQIAAEKGVTLPKPRMGGHGMWHGRGPDNDNDQETNDDVGVTSSASAQ